MSGKVFYIIGKSSSGKDTIYKRLLSETNLKPIVPYTTRPMREGEREGVEYHFVFSIEEMQKKGDIIESRSYNTKLGVWTYATVNDGQIDLSSHSYLTIGTISSYLKVREYLVDVLPIYIEVDDGIRLQRALDRERMEKIPKYSEMCRRFLSDEEDFSEDKLRVLGLERIFKNIDLNICIKEIKNYVKGVTGCEL